VVERRADDRRRGGQPAEELTMPMPATKTTISQTTRGRNVTDMPATPTLRSAAGSSG